MQTGRSKLWFQAKFIKTQIVTIAVTDSEYVLVQFLTIFTSNLNIFNFMTKHNLVLAG